MDLAHHQTHAQTRAARRSCERRARSPQFSKTFALGHKQKSIGRNSRVPFPLKFKGQSTHPRERVGHYCCSYAEAEPLYDRALAIGCEREAHARTSDYSHVMLVTNLDLLLPLRKYFPYFIF
jgi:hypothetical protein